MNWRGVLFQTLFATAIWGLGMHFAFGWPREGLLVPMAAFAVVMFAVLAGIGFRKSRRKPE